MKKNKIPHKDEAVTLRKRADNKELTPWSKFINKCQEILILVRSLALLMVMSALAFHYINNGEMLSAVHYILHMI